MEKNWRDKLRIFLIIYFFSDKYNDAENSDWVRLLRGETKIQKIDFLIRYPSYLCYELMNLTDTNSQIDSNEIKSIVKTIFDSNEPELRRIDMQRFFFGAWESIDEIISFLDSHALIKFFSRKSTDDRVIAKEYFVTNLGSDRIETGLKEIPILNWYKERCELISKYFGDFTGTELRVSQYSHPEYASTPIGTYIKDIEDRTRELFISKYSEPI
jgi:hypothetical protein